MLEPNFPSSFRFMVLFFMDVKKNKLAKLYTHELLEVSDFGSVLNDSIHIIN